MLQVHGQPGLPGEFKVNLNNNKLLVLSCTDQITNDSSIQLMAIAQCRYKANPCRKFYGTMLEKQMVTHSGVCIGIDNIC